MPKKKDSDSNESLEERPEMFGDWVSDPFDYSMDEEN
jgi:hypothetical protein